MEVSVVDFVVKLNSAIGTTVKSEGPRTRTNDSGEEVRYGKLEACIHISSLCVVHCAMDWEYPIEQPDDFSCSDPQWHITPANVHVSSVGGGRLSQQEILSLAIEAQGDLLEEIKFRTKKMKEDIYTV